MVAGVHQHFAIELADHRVVFHHKNAMWRALCLYDLIYFHIVIVGCKSLRTSFIFVLISFICLYSTIRTSIVEITAIPKVWTKFFCLSSHP
jgi:uncharacterized membrane protein YcaP (DUF421 family)